MARRSDPRIKRYEARGSVRYRVIMDAGYTEDGRRRQLRRSFATRAEAVRFVAETDGALATGEFIAPATRTFEAMAEDWLAAKSATLRGKTVTGYRSGIRPYVEAFGERRVQDLELRDVEAVVAAQVRAGKTKRTVQYGLGLVRQVLDRAVRQRIVAVNVAKLAETGGALSAPSDAYTQTELAALVRAARGHRLEHAFLLSLSGVSRSELMALQWADVDLAEGVLRIERSRTVVNGSGTETNDPKTVNRYRAIPLDGVLVAALREARVRQSAVVGPVVADEWGRPMHPDAYSNRWAELVESAGVRKLDGLLAARRSSVTAMRDRGVGDHVVARWHGHDEVVMRRAYSKAHVSELRAAGGVMGDVLRGAQ